jgi:hypothetical protein
MLAPIVLLLVALRTEGGRQRTNLSFNLPVRLRVTSGTRARLNTDECGELRIVMCSDAWATFADDRFGYAAMMHDPAHEARRDLKGAVGLACRMRVLHFLEPLYIHLNSVVSTFGQWSRCWTL